MGWDLAVVDVEFGLFLDANNLIGYCFCRQKVVNKFKTRYSTRALHGFH